DAVGKIDGVAAKLGFLVEPRTGAHVMRHVGYGHMDDPTVRVSRIWVLRGMHGVVVIACVDGIDRKELKGTQIGAARELGRLQMLDLGQHGAWELVRNAMRVDGDETDLALVLGIAERFNNARFGYAKLAGARDVEANEVAVGGTALLAARDAPLPQFLA